MNIEEFRAYCLSFKGTSEGMPFDGQTLVFYVGTKMFALTNVDTFASVNLKCDPEYAIQLREEYDAVRPGYHMNKKHWNTVDINGTVPVIEFKKWVKDSYDLVFKSLTKKAQKEIEELDE